jgi:hypothetical protein
MSLGNHNIQHHNLHVHLKKLATRRTQNLDESSEVPDSEGDIEDSSESDCARKQAWQNLTTPYSADSNGLVDLKFHQDTWVDILKQAKRLFLLWLVIQCPWP